MILVFSSNDNSSNDHYHKIKLFNQGRNCRHFRRAGAAWVTYFCFYVDQASSAFFSPAKDPIADREMKQGPHPYCIFLFLKMLSILSYRNMNGVCIVAFHRSLTFCAAHNPVQDIVLEIVSHLCAVNLEKYKLLTRHKT